VQDGSVVRGLRVDFFVSPIQMNFAENAKWPTKAPWRAAYETNAGRSVRVGRLGPRGGSRVGKSEIVVKKRGFKLASGLGGCG
jgi:hypothetical protein